MSRATAVRSPARSLSAMSFDWLKGGGAGAGRIRGSHEQRARDDDALDVARALVDLGDARVAEQALDFEVVGVAGAGVDLQALVGAEVGRGRSHELRLRRFERTALAAVAL